MPRKWTVTEEMHEVHLTRVFSGGACNIISADGQLLRNAERDPINDWLSARSLRFFDPQIHPDTHGVEYEFEKHFKLEVAARRVAKINLYEISPRTFGGITSLEIAADRFRWREPLVLYYSDGDPLRDSIPVHSMMGHPLFAPYGLRDNETAMRAHYREMIKNANNMRKHLVAIAQDMSGLTITFSDYSRASDIVVTPERMHAADLFRAVAQAAAMQRVNINFTGGERARDARGNPLFLAPDDPQEVQRLALLDQYLDEGNELRRAIAELIGVNVFVRVVYTQKSAVLALEEVLRLKGLIQ